MIYRRLQESDLPKIIELMKKHNITYEHGKPLIGWVAVTETEEIIGVIFGHQCVLIEPFICENSTAGVKLYYAMAGSISSTGTKITLAHVKSENEKLDKEIQKAGFTEINGQDFKVYKKVDQ